MAAGGADEHPGDLQHRLHQHVRPGDDPQADGLRVLQLPAQPLQHLRRHHRHHQVSWAVRAASRSHLKIYMAVPSKAEALSPQRHSINQPIMKVTQPIMKVSLLFGSV